MEAMCHTPREGNPSPWIRGVWWKERKKERKKERNERKGKKGKGEVIFPGFWVLST